MATRLVGAEADPDLATSAGGTSDVATQPTVAATTAATWSGTGCALLHPTPPLTHARADCISAPHGEG